MKEQPTLRKLQQTMAAHILGGARGERRVRASAVESWIRVPPHTKPAERLHVHIDGYPARVHEALEEAFPAVAHIAGPRAFADLTRRYVAAVDLRSYNLNDAGAGLADFLRRDVLAERLPFLPDLGKLEWLVMRAFHARQRAPMRPADLADRDLVDWQDALLRFQPSVAIICSPWPILTLWECRDTPVEEIDVDLRDRPQRVLVHRADLAVYCQLVAAAEAHALAALLGAASLGQAVESLAAHSESPDAVFGRFARWVRAGMVTAVERSTDSAR